MANWDKFDFAFTCPESVTAEDLKLAHKTVYAEMREESEGLELSAADVMLGSVMLNWFIKHLFTSRTEYGEKTGYQHPGQEKDAISMFHTVAREYGDILRKSRPRVGGGLSKEQVTMVLFAALETVSDPAQRAFLQDKFADALAEV